MNESAPATTVRRRPYVLHTTTVPLAYRLVSEGWPGPGALPGRCTTEAVLGALELHVTAFFPPQAASESTQRHQRPLVLELLQQKAGPATRGRSGALRPMSEC